jgi:hypothetical protein
MALENAQIRSGSLVWPARSLAKTPRPHSCRMEGFCNEGRRSQCIHMSADRLFANAADRTLTTLPRNTHEDRSSPPGRRRALHYLASDSKMSSMRIRNSRAIRKASVRLGSYFSVSIAFTVWRDTPRCFARSPCDQSRVALRTLRRDFNCISTRIGVDLPRRAPVEEHLQTSSSPGGSQRSGEIHRRCCRRPSLNTRKWPPHSTGAFATRPAHAIAGRRWPPRKRLGQPELER